MASMDLASFDLSLQPTSLIHINGVQPDDAKATGGGDPINSPPLQCGRNVENASSNSRLMVGVNPSSCASGIINASGNARNRGNLETLSEHKPNRIH